MFVRELQLAAVVGAQPIVAVTPWWMVQRRVPNSALIAACVVTLVTSIPVTET